MRSMFRRGCCILVSASLVVSPVLAQAPAPPPAPQATSSAAEFSAEQLDALLAPIALYPDPLLAQVLMASTYPVEIVAASRWLASADNKDLKGDDLATALAAQPWDPSVKSLVPFPQVLEMMNQQLDWTQQLGYAVATQQEDVMDSVQRLRRQAQEAGTLQSTPQQTVTTVATTTADGTPAPEPAIVIQPADPQVVYVPVYNPAVAFGIWPYPATPPVYFPAPPGYAIGTAFASGLAFGAGVAVVGSLWGWATPRWGGYGYGCCGGGSINVNTTRYNNITVSNINRASFQGGRWQGPANQRGNPALRPGAGPVGPPRRGNGLPANAIGRPSVKVPGQVVNRPNIGGGRATSGLNRPNAGGGTNQPNAGQGGLAANRPGAGSPLSRPNAGAGTNRPGLAEGGGNRPNGGSATRRPNLGERAVRPAAAPGARSGMPAARPSSGALGGINDGARAAQFQQRGAQSLAQRQARAAPQGGARAPGGRAVGGRDGGGGRPGGRQR